MAASAASSPWGGRMWWVTAAAVLAGSAAAWSALHKLTRSRKRYGGLDTVVGYSARAVAAARALEDMREDALFRDPLALALAGPQAMARARSFMERRQAHANGEAAKGVAQEASSAPQGAGAPATDGTATAPAAAAASASSGDAASAPQAQEDLQQQQTSADAAANALVPASEQPPPPPRRVGRIVMRTLAFDSAVLLATRGEEPLFCHEGLRETWRLAGAQACTQVVLLGAGMDTRAWRLALPPGVAWFEVDMADVMAAKRAIMTQAGAEWPREAVVVDARTGRVQSSQAGRGDKADVEVFVTHEWQRQRGKAEGSPAKAQPLPFRAASYAGVVADLQERGWSAGLMAAGFSGAKRTLWVLEGLTYYLEPSAVPAIFKEMADVSAPGSMTIVSAVPGYMLQALKQGGGGRRESRRDSANIMNAWKWGVPGADEKEWAEFFAPCGWRTTSFDHWDELVRECGFVPEEMPGTRERLLGGKEQAASMRKFSLFTAVKA